ALKDGDKVIGNRTRVKVVKNKLAPPFKDCEFDIIYGRGIAKEGDLLDLGVAHDLINKSGTWFSYKDQRIGQGRENAKTFLLENPDIYEEIENGLRQKLGLRPGVPAAVETAEETDDDEPKKRGRKAQAEA
ncbi:MAG: DNA recombination/repair protein RecA, partial [Nitrospina sp.]|nr:DNA recombination/repair protein RecA [Nitrospina sp.]